MATANPLPTYPNDEIPLTDRHWRERWAKELTRANALENELRECRNARDAARLTRERAEALELVDDLRSRLEKTHEMWAAEVKKDIERIVLAEQRLAAEVKRANALAKWIDESGVDHSDLEDLIREAGVDCPECATHGPSDECSLLCVDGLVLR